MADEELKRVSHIARQRCLASIATPPRPSGHPKDHRSAIDETVAIDDRRLGYRQIALQTHLSGLRIRALHGEFRQIVSNLVVNAIDASPQGSAIEVRAWRSTHPVTGAPGIRLVVADQGLGIPRSIRRQIFTPLLHHQEGCRHRPRPLDRQKVCCRRPPAPSCAAAASQTPESTAPALS